jgi:hypothetical protein
MTTLVPLHPAAKIRITSGNKCGLCTRSHCCTYLTQQIDTPRSMEEFDVLLWQLAHRDVQAYKDEEGWFLLVNNPCLHLRPDGRCGIYETRPKVCREHSNEDCEFDGLAGADDFELFFPDYASLDAWCRRKFKHWDRRFAGKKK